MDARVRIKSGQQFDAQISFDTIMMVYKMHQHLISAYRCHDWDHTAQQFCRFHMKSGYCRINIELNPLLTLRVRLVDDVTFQSFVQYLDTKINAKIKDDRNFYEESQGPIQ